MLAFRGSRRCLRTKTARSALRTAFQARFISSKRRHVPSEALRRSAMYVPGSSEKHMKKATTLPADVLIFDLEDAVAPDAKDAARHQVRQFLDDPNVTVQAREIVVRVNSLDSTWGRLDVAALADCERISAFVLPKTEEPSDVVELLSSLNRAGGQGARVWCMIETPRGVLRCDAIADSASEVECLVAGTQDLTKELQARYAPGRAPLLYSLSRIVAVARAHGLACLDGVYPRLQADEEFRRECEQGRDFGFDGKCLIHPSTLDVCNEVFLPSTEEVEFARKVVRAADERGHEEGVIVVDHQLIEELHIAQARRMLSLARQAGTL